jgi:hypothetical protein
LSTPKNFFHWLKNETITSPARKVDQSIVDLANNSIVDKKPVYFSKYLIVSSALVASLILLFNTTNLNKINQHPFSESPELLAYYDQIELMSQASGLSDNEWESILKEERP